jgi:hypothetical protein
MMKLNAISQEGYFTNPSITCLNGYHTNIINILQDFTADIGLHLTWKDTKLMENIRQYKYTFDYLDFDALNMEKVWVPDIYFPNEKKAAVHNIMMANKMLRLYKNSTVSYKIRYTLLTTL